MKFSCERCGKKYATAESPAPGKVYKLKCKACGHVIVVRPPATATGLPAAGARPYPDGPRPTPAPLPRQAPPAPGSGAAPDPEPEPGAEATRTPPPMPALANGAAEPALVPPRPRADDTTEVAMSALGGTSTSTAVVPEPGAVRPPADAEPRSSTRDDEFRPPPGDTGYVDLFADGGDGHDAPPAGDGAPPEPSSHGASLQGSAEDYDPFASVRAELDAASTDAPPAAASEPPPAPPKAPEIPRPASHRGEGRTPFLLIGAGVLVIIGILAFALLKAKPPAPAGRALGAAAVPSPTLEPSAQEVDASPQGTPDPPPVEVRLDDLAPPREAPPADRKDRTAAADRNRKRPPSRPEPRVEPRIAPAPAAPEPAPRREEVKVALPSETEGLSPETVQKVLASTRRAFDGCIANARKSDLKLDGRRVVLRLTINTSGAVTYPTLDDVTLNGTEMGSCLKSAARLMVFPKFGGDPLRIEVPLTLAER